MPDPVITNVDNGSVANGPAVHRDETLKFTGADTYAEGTILARDTGDDKLIAYVKGGVTAGNGIPNSVMTYPVTVTGAGDVAIRAMVEGEVKKERLVIDADGDATNVDAVVIDELRARGITAVDTAQLAQLDNQP